MAVSEVDIQVVVLRSSESFYRENTATNRSLRESQYRTQHGHRKKADHLRLAGYSVYQSAYPR
jgi:hypothetical protein